MREKRYPIGNEKGSMKSKVSWCTKARSAIEIDGVRPLKHTVYIRKLTGVWLPSRWAPSSPTFSTNATYQPHNTIIFIILNVQKKNNWWEKSWVELDISWHTSSFLHFVLEIYRTKRKRTQTLQNSPNWISGATTFTSKEHTPSVFDVICFWHI